MRSVLRADNVRWLLVSSLVGRVPAAAAAIVMVELVRGQHGSYAVAGLLVSLFAGGNALGQPMLGRVIDRRGQTEVLVVAASISTAAFVVLALAGAHHPPAASVAAAIAGFATPPLEPCLRSLWPTLVDAGPALRAAFSLDAGAQELVFLTGPLIAVLAVTVGGPAGGVWAAAGIGALGAIPFASNRASRAWRSAPRSGRDRDRLWDKHFRLLIGAAVAVGAPLETLPILASRYADHQGERALTGLTLTAFALGAFIGGILAGTFGTRIRDRRLLPYAALAFGSGFLLLTIPWPVALWLPAAALAGGSLPFLMTQIFVTVEEGTPQSRLTEANSWVISAMLTGSSAAAALAGLVADAVDFPWTLVAIAGGVALAPLSAAVVLLRSLRTTGETAGPTDDTVQVSILRR